MPAEGLIAQQTEAARWREVRTWLETTQQELASAPAGIARQMPFMALLAAERQCTGVIHRWFAEALSLQRVEDPRVVLSLDVDGVLEDEAEGFSSTNLAGAAALRLLQLGRVAVLLNTARCLADVQQRVAEFKLLGGTASLGAAVWDGVFDREVCLLTDRGAAQIDEVRAQFRRDATVVLDPFYAWSVRASRMRNGKIGPVTGEEARRLLDRAGLDELAYWVAPRHTDFVDRGVDKAQAMDRLRSDLGLQSLPLAAIGDSACDLPMLKVAQMAFMPAASLPSYLPPRRQRLLRSSHLGGQALWDAACHLVPNPGLQRRVLSMVRELSIPSWMPEHRREAPAGSRSPLRARLPSFPG